jgi:hypothetical protein
MNVRLYMRLAAAMALSGWLTVIATASAAEKKGREPPRTLEDLLLQAEQMANQQPANAPVPAAPNPVPQPVDPQHIVNEMQRLIAARDQIVARAQLFQTLRELRELEPQFLQLVVQVHNAQRNFNAAQNQLNVINKMAANAPPGAPGPDPAAVAAAQNSFNNANQQLRNAVQNRDIFFVNKLRPRFQRVQAEFPRFLQNYVLMRKLIPLDRKHPASGPLLNELQNSIPHRNDFVEGHILAGILYAYDGNANAQAEFKKASDINEPCGLACSLLGYDCCYGLVIAGAPDDIPKEYITFLKKLDPKRQTTAVCWLVGARAFAKGQHNEATTFLQKALTKAEGAASPQLRGELSWLYLFAENTRDIEKAQKVLKGLDATSAWQVKRAHAGIAAEQGSFDKAIELMEGCRASAPPAFDAELADQQNAYKSGKAWLRQVQ